MKLTKRLLSLFVAVVMIISMIPAVSATEAEPEATTKAAADAIQIATAEQWNSWFFGSANQLNAQYAGSTETVKFVLTASITITPNDKCYFSTSTGSAVKAEIDLGGNTITVSAASAVNVFAIYGGSTVTFKNGSIVTTKPIGTLGGLFTVQKGTLNLSDLAITDNDTTAYNSYGKLVYVAAAGTMTMNNVQFTGSTANRGTARMGGFFNIDGTVNATNCTFTDTCTSTASVLAFAGMIHVNKGTSSFTGCTFNCGVAKIGTAIGVTSGNVSITQCRFVGGTATTGGALGAKNGTITVSECSFENNAGVFGGAIYLEAAASLTLKDSSITGATAATRAAAIFVYNSTATKALTMIDTDISDCSAPAGGGVVVWGSGTASIEGGEIYNCSATTGYGGGLIAYGNLNNNVHVNVTDTTIRNCSAKTYGGNVYIYGTQTTVNNVTYRCTVDFNNCTIEGGRAQYGGNLIADQYCDVDIYNTTIQDGEATASGGNLFISAATVNFHSGLIKGGEAATSADSVWVRYANAVLSVYGGEIQANAGEGAVVCEQNGVIKIYSVSAENFDPAAFVVDGESVAVKTGETTAIVKHLPVEGATTTVPATCVAAGSETIVCAKCAHTYTNELPATGHSYSTVVTDPTCTAEGYTTYTCTACGDSYVADKVPVIEHAWNEGVIDPKPTCNDEGTRTFTCSACGATKTEAVSSLGHNYKPVVTDPTCSAEGYTTYTCTACGDSYIADKVDAVGHSYSTVVTDPTCTAEGYTTYTCTACGDSYIADKVAATGHNYEAVKTEATFEADAFTTYTCTGCGHSYVETHAGTKLEKVLEGSGTQADPYRITNLEELILFRDLVNTYKQDGSNQFYQKYVRLDADIDLAGINWEPIGINAQNDHNAFLGTFDGNGHTISNLYVEKAGSNLGFFAYTGHYDESRTAAYIKNLTFENVTVKSTNNGTHVGGVIGNSGAWTYVDNVKVTGTVDIAGRAYVGGIVGHGYPKIDNCHVLADGTITCNYWCCGGIVGYAGEGGTRITNSSVVAPNKLTVTTVAGGAAAVCGLNSSSNYFENLHAENVDVVSLGNGYNPDFCLGYVVGNGEENSTTTDLTAKNVNIIAGGNAGTSTDGEVTLMLPPNATVAEQDALTLKAGEYAVYDGSLHEGTKDLPLEIVVNFKAEDTEEACLAGGYSDWLVDFNLTLSGMSGDSITVNNSYLAGNYGEFGWIAIPTDGLVLEEGVNYPVVAVAGIELTYKDIVTSVKDFTAAIHIDQAILDANPDLQVKLDLVMTNPENAEDKLYVGEQIVYTAEDLANKKTMPNATVAEQDAKILMPGGYSIYDGSLKNGTEYMPLEIVVNFAAEDTLEECLAGGYSKWLVDFNLTLSGMSGSTITADNCYLAGNYGEFGWIAIPTDGMVLENGVTYPVVSGYDATLNYKDICKSVKNFTAAIHIDQAILDANPDLEVKLELVMTNPENAEEKMQIGEDLIYTFEKLTNIKLPEAVVTPMGKLTLEENEYRVWNGMTRHPEITEDKALNPGEGQMPLEVLVNFQAKDTLEECLAGGFSQWLVDFNITIEGLENGSFVADNCYLAGNYGSFGWIKIPLDGQVIEEGVTYPVVALYDNTLNYKDICKSVKDFTAAIHIDPEILEANRDISVKLELVMTNPENAEEKMQIGEDLIYRFDALYSGAVAQNVQTGLIYSTIKSAMNASQTGDTIILLADHQEADVSVKMRRTLDLNGHVLTVETMNCTFVGAQLVDSTDGKGLLVVERDAVAVSANNEDMPVWCEGEGYRFVKVSFKQSLKLQSGKGYFRFYLEGNDPYCALQQAVADGGEDNGVFVRVLVEWTDKGGNTGSRIFTYSEERIMEYAADWTGKEFKLYVSGMENVSQLKLTAMLVSEANENTNVAISGETKTLEINN